MNFSLTENQIKFKNLAARFVEMELKDADEWDRNANSDNGMFKKLGEYGLLGIPFSKEYGGGDGDYFSYYLVIEELSKRCASTALHVSGCVSLFIWPLLMYGNDKQKEIVKKVIAGDVMGSFMLTEEEAGSDAANIQLRAELDGDYYILNGKKVLTTNVRYSNYIIIFASTNLEKGSKGITAFLVEKETEGIFLENPQDKMGLRATETCSVQFKNVKIHKSCRLGEEGKGLIVAFSSLDGSRVGIAAQALGIAEGAFEIAVNYIKKRKQFGKSISQFQGVQWMVAEMKTKISASRLLTYNAAYMRDKNVSYGIEASEAKYFASETANFVTSKAVQLLGGNGYLNNYSVERMMRDAKITEIYEGTTEILKTIIGGNALK